MSKLAVVLSVGTLLLGANVGHGSNADPAPASQHLKTTVDEQIQFNSIKTQFLEKVDPFVCNKLQEDGAVWQWATKNAVVQGKWRAAKDSLGKTAQILREPVKDYQPVLESLMSITTNGFYATTRFFLNKTPQDDRYPEIEATFNELWQLLWQARELISYAATDQDSSSYKLSQAVRHLSLRFPGNPELRTVGLDLLDQSVAQKDPEAIQEYEQLRYF